MLLARTAQAKLAKDVCVIDLRGLVSYTDHFVVVTGQNSRQTRAIAEHVMEALKEKGYRRPRRRESDPDGSWILLDYGDAIMHIFTPESREFYRLESLWGQVPQIRLEDEEVDGNTPSGSEVELDGLEPTTSSLPAKRSPN